MSKPIPQLEITGIVDKSIQKNFEKIRDFIRAESPLLGFRFFEVVFDKAKTNYRFPHSLGYSPKDIVLTSRIGVGSVTFNYSLFDSEALDITTTDAVTIRFFVGTANTGAG